MSIKDYVKKTAGESWKEHCASIAEKLNETSLKLKNIIDTENYYREEHKDEKKLKKALGDFTKNTIDEKLLASVLSKGDDKRSIPENRLKRIKVAYNSLSKFAKMYSDSPPVPVFSELKNNVQEIINGYDKHAAENIDFIKQYRIGSLEVKAAYDESIHDKFFKDFNWKKMNNEELSFLTPFIVTAEGTAGENDLGDIIKLVSAGRPIKTAILQKTIIDAESNETGRAAVLKLNPDLGFMGVSLRKIFVLQGSLAHPDGLKNGISSGINSTRPALFSIYSPEGKSEDEIKEKSMLLLRSRAFTHLVYDPDKHADFVKCLDIEMNPDIENPSPSVRFQYVSESGETKAEAYNFTFADYVKQISGFEKEYEEVKDINPGSSYVTLYKYLTLDYEQRQQKKPVIYALNGQNKMQQYLVPKNIVALTTDKFHLWRTFQQLAGVKNPFVAEIEQKTKEALANEKDRAVSDIKAKMTAEIENKTKEAVTLAMRNLAMKLTGISNMPTASVSVSATSVPSASSAPAVAAAQESADTSGGGEEPWIETELCTACDECIIINKNIFVYNENKQVIIKDMKGGPYRDIVKAAEKCPAKIIHPGLPLDSNEKDVEKWIKRAEKYN